MACLQSVEGSQIGSEVPDELHRIQAIDLKGEHVSGRRAGWPFQLTFHGVRSNAVDEILHHPTPMMFNVARIIWRSQRSTVFCSISFFFFPRKHGEGFFRWVHLSCFRESHYIIMKVIARSHCKESLQGVIARSHCKESLQGVIARSHESHCKFQGAKCMESSASCKCKEFSASCKCMESSASCNCMESSASCNCMESSASCKCKESSASCKCKESSAI